VTKKFEPVQLVQISEPKSMDSDIMANPVWEAW